MGHQSSSTQKPNNNTLKKPPDAKLDNKRRRITPTEMDEKRAQGIRFFCDENFTHGHNCRAKRHLYSMELEVLDDQQEGVEIEEDREVVAGEPEEVLEEPLENCSISLQALNGTLGYKILRLRGFTKQKPIEVFIDCGSTHNFIDEDTTRRLGCEIYKIRPQLVQVDDGKEVHTEQMCKVFGWLMQGAIFQDDFLVFPIEKCD